MNQSIYVHIDTTSNVVVTRGIQTRDFHAGVIHPPKNLLLLNPATEYGDYETHTGMKVIRGTDAVDNYAQLISKGRAVEDTKWIDFADFSMLKELSPLEISELLYFGHMRNYLHSPFFYKLQNNFVYFDLPQNISRVYYRYLDEFYRILAGKLKRLVLEKLNERIGFFKRPKSVDPLPAACLNELRDVMKEGIIFCFKDAQKIEKEFTIPIYFVDEELAQTTTFSPDMYVGKLSYHIIKRTWSLQLEEENLLFIK